MGHTAHLDHEHGPVGAWLLELNDLLEWAPNTLALTAAIAMGGFALLYFSASNWRSTDAGRSMMGVAVAITALLSMNTIHLATGVYPGIVVTRILVYATLTYAGIRLFRTLVIILKGGQPITVRTHFPPKETRPHDLPPTDPADFDGDE